MNSLRKNRSKAICSCFDQVAKIESIKRKWISLDLHIDLMIRQSKYPIILNLDTALIKRNVLAYNKLSRDDKRENPSGYYFREKILYKRNLDGGGKAHLGLKHISSLLRCESFPTQV